MVPEFTEWLTEVTGFSAEVQEKLVLSLLLALSLIIIRTLILKMVFKYQKDTRTQYHIRKTCTYTISILLLIILCRIWIRGFTDISTYFGLLSAGLAVALKDLIVNLAAWVFIMWRRPFEVGDRIQIGEQKGDVIDQRLFMFTLLEIGNWVDADQSTGRIIHISNGTIFREPLASYSKGFEHIWCEIPVLITFESDWEKAKQLLETISKASSLDLSNAAQQKIQKAARKYMIFYNNLSPIVYTSVKDSGVLLTIRYLTPPRQRRHREQEIWEQILHEFSKHTDIDFAYKTTRIYTTSQETTALETNIKAVEESR